MTSCTASYQKHFKAIRLITWGRTIIWNLPCIWPIVRGLSSLSVPARTSNFGAFTCRYSSDSPWYQPCQNGWLIPRSVLHTHLCLSTAVCLINMLGSEIAAASIFFDIPVVQHAHVAVMTVSTTFSSFTRCYSHDQIQWLILCRSSVTPSQLFKFAISSIRVSPLQFWSFMVFQAKQWERSQACVADNFVLKKVMFCR